MRNKHMMAQAIYRPKPGKEEEFLKLWKEGPVMLTQRSGGYHISIYFCAERNEYISTAHWKDRAAFDKYQALSELKPWMDKINAICRSPAERTLLDVVLENAA